MKSKYIIIAFVVTVLLQIAIPAKMVWDNESASLYGTEYRFRTAPVDPNDPFRGKYIALRFEENEATVSDTTWSYGETGYVILGKDSSGFAYIKRLTREKPTLGDYVKVTTQHYYNGRVAINYPFRRFYMEESKAPDAEIFYLEQNSEEARIPAYAVVKIKGETTVLNDVILDGLPVKDYVEKHRNNK